MVGAGSATRTRNPFPPLSSVANPDPDENTSRPHHRGVRHPHWTAPRRNHGSLLRAGYDSHSLCAAIEQIEASFPLRRRAELPPTQGLDRRRDSCGRYARALG